MLKNGCIGINISTYTMYSSIIIMCSCEIQVQQVQHTTDSCLQVNCACLKRIEVERKKNVFEKEDISKNFSGRF